MTFERLTKYFIKAVILFYSLNICRLWFAMTDLNEDQYYMTVSITTFILFSACNIIMDNMIINE